MWVTTSPKGVSAAKRRQPDHFFCCGQPVTDAAAAAPDAGTARCLFRPTGTSLGDCSAAERGFRSAAGRFAENAI
jgi:hypothetical protein